MNATRPIFARLLPVLAALALAAAPRPAAAQNPPNLTLHDTGTATVSGSGTTATGNVTLSPPGDFSHISSYTYIQPYDTSQVTVASGGLAVYLYAHNSSQVSIQPGAMVSNTFLYDTSRLTATGPFYLLSAYGSSQANISGDTTSQDNVTSKQHSQVTLGQGNVSTLSAADASQDVVGAGCDLYTLTTSGTAQVQLQPGSFVESALTSGSSQITAQTGALVDEVTTTNTSRVMLVGTTVPFNAYVKDTSVLTISGGRIGYGQLPNNATPPSPFGVFAQNSGTVTVTGGDLILLSLADTSTANISGGHINAFAVAGSSVANISGGFFEHGLFAEDTTTLNISGGSFRFLGSGAGTGTINLTGTGLKVTTLGTDRYVTGTLASGEALNAFFGGGILKFNGTVQSLPAPPDEASRAAPGAAGTRVASRR